MSKFKMAALITPFAIILATTTAGACDPEDLKAEYRALCATPTDAVLQMVQASNRLKPETHTALLTKAKEAQGLCLADKYDEAMRLAVKVAKSLGATEQEAGLPQEQLAQATDATKIEASTKLSVR